METEPIPRVRDHNQDDATGFIRHECIALESGR
jgi:hypothetical protein